jgi:hypothetical protein
MRYNRQVQNYKSRVIGQSFRRETLKEYLTRTNQLEKVRALAERPGQIGIPHTLENRKVMFDFTDWTFATVCDGPYGMTIWLTPRNGNAIW